MGDKRGAYKVLMGRPERKNHLEDLSIDGRIILIYIFKKWEGEKWIGLIWLRIEHAGGACECGDKLSGFMK
jgi:hypothetical protein